MGRLRHAVASRRILINGLSSPWGGRLAQQLESDPSIEAVIGVDTEDPRHELQRTEFVRVGPDDILLRRILRAAQIDTVVDTRLVTDAFLTDPADAREVNVRGTYALLAAAGGRDTPVRTLVFKSSAQFYGFGRGPAFFTEDVAPAGPPQTSIERDIALAERALEEFAQDNPSVAVTVLRYAPAIGAGVRSAHMSLLSMPVIPSILGFDPRWQFIDEEDVLGVLAHAVHHPLRGVYNAAADGVLALSEVCSALGKPMLPVLPPWGTVLAAVQLRRIGLRMPVELLRDLRQGRGLDNRRLKAAGYAYRYTTHEAVVKLRAAQRLRPLLGPGDTSYRYEREVEEFLRRSPNVQATLQAGQRQTAPAGAGDRRAGYEDLDADELLGIVDSLDTESLRQLRDHERAGQARSVVIGALDRVLGDRDVSSRG